MTATDPISAAKLAVYLAFLPFSLYCLWKHGKTGFLGWFYVHIFCLLRIATGGVGLHGDQHGEAYVILNSIGLSPLLISLAGVLHEAKRGIEPRLNRKMNIFWQIQFHFFVGIGMVLIIVPIVHLMSRNYKSHDKTLLHIGSAVSCIAWLIVVLWALQSLFKSRRSSKANDPHAMRGGRVLLYAVFASLPFAALRLGYAVAYLQLMVTQSTSGFLTSKAAQVCLNVVPEMLVVAILLAAGTRTRALKNHISQRDRDFASRNSSEMR